MGSGYSVSASRGSGAERLCDVDDAPSGCVVSGETDVSGEAKRTCFVLVGGLEGFRCLEGGLGRCMACSPTSILNLNRRVSRVLSRS